MPEPSESASLINSLIEDPGQGRGAMLLEVPLRSRIISGLNSWLGIKIKLQYYDVDGNYLSTGDGDVRMSPRGTIITLPITPGGPLGGGGGGGGGGTPGFPWQTPKKELNPLVAVTSGTAVYVSPNNPLVGTGLVDLVSNVLTSSRPGIWLSLQNIPAETGAGKYNVPQVPYPSNGGTVSGSPLTGDADQGNLYWVLLSPTPYC